MRKKVLAYARETYGTEPEYLWERYPDCAVLRRRDNRKWYGIIMAVKRSKLGLEGEENADVLNVKIGETGLRDALIDNRSIFKPYHMAAGTWVSIILDGTVAMKEISDLMDISYLAVADKRKAK